MNSGMVTALSAAIVNCRNRLANSVQLSQTPMAAQTGTHNSTSPPVKASAGSASIVHALVVDDPVLSAAVKLLSRRPPSV